MKYFLFDFSARCMIVWSMLYISYIIWPVGDNGSMWVGYLVATILQFPLTFGTYKGWK